MLIRALTPLLRRISRSMLTFDEEDGTPRLPSPEPGRSYMAYLHIPFCESLCPFCSFHRVAYRPDRAERYFRALREEIRHYHHLGFACHEIYIGGGTPTVDMDELARTLECLHEHFDLRRISVETNPNHLDLKLLERLRGLGVSRLSVGVQSFDDALLRAMGLHQEYRGPVTTGSFRIRRPLQGSIYHCA